MTEALRRNKTENDAEGAAEGPRQQLFAPAWSLSADSGERATVPAATEPAVVESGQMPAVPSAGSISFASRWRERLATGPEADPALTEQFRRLAATLHHAHRANNLRSVMVTSAAPGDGKTLTAVNLALVLAESYHYNVLLMDADLRRPSIPNVIELSEGSGLSQALRSDSERRLALVPITPRLTLLPAGEAIANSIEALTSPRMRRILDEAMTRFDWVIVDAPPVGPATDARLLSQMVGGTLFVVHAGRTQHPDVQKAIDSLGREQILGVVLNGVEPTASGAYYYGTAGPAK